MTYTIEQIEEQFKCDFTDEERQKYAQSLRDRMDNAATAELFVNITEVVEEQAKRDPVEYAAYQQFTPLDKILFAVREAYIFGSVQALEMMTKANKMGIDALEKGGACNV